MGSYKFSREVFDLVYDKLGKTELDDLLEGISKFLDPKDKTVDEVLSELYEIQESKEDRIGTIYRFMKYTGGQKRLSEESEEDLAESKHLSFLIWKVESLKQWMEGNSKDQKEE